MSNDELVLKNCSFATVTNSNGNILFSGGDLVDQPLNRRVKLKSVYAAVNVFELGVNSYFEAETWNASFKLELDGVNVTPYSSAMSRGAVTDQYFVLTDRMPFLDFSGFPDIIFDEVVFPNGVCRAYQSGLNGLPVAFMNGNVFLYILVEPTT